MKKPLYGDGSKISGGDRLKIFSGEGWLNDEQVNIESFVRMNAGSLVKMNTRSCLFSF